MKLWSGRFTDDTAPGVDEFGASITFDCRLYREDIEGSIAHAGMLGAQGIIDPAEAGRIIDGLRGILADIEAGKIEFDVSTEDIHMSVEAELTRRIGDAGKRLHTARSRNDQVALDIRLFLKRKTAEIRREVVGLMEAVLRAAERGEGVIMPAYTHLQRAQPTTFSHYMMAYANMLRRDAGRLSDCLRRMDEMPLGSGALTGTTYPIDRERVMGELGFARLTENSLDGVSDRDFALELLSCLAVLMTHLSRFSEEIILWCSWEFKFIELDDRYATGSSIMPQKKNPDIAELVRGKTGRVYGDLIALLTVMKSLPLAYNKDMQEDKEPVFDAVDTALAALPIFARMVDTMRLLPENMRRAAGEGFINATDCADWLVKQGLPFRDAYTIVGGLVSRCIAGGKTLETLTLDEYRAQSPVFTEAIFDAIALPTCVAARDVPGGPAPRQVRAQMDSIRAFIAENSQNS